MTDTPITTRGAPFALVVDAQTLRRASVTSFLAPWAETSRLTLHAVSGTPEVESYLDQNAGSCALVVLSLGGTPVCGAARADIELVQRRLPQVPLVIISDLEEPEDVVAAFHAGVRGFIPTSLPPDVALQTFTYLLCGGSYFPPAAMVRPAGDEARAGRPHHTAHGAAEGSGPGRLTGRQAEVLALLRQGKSNKMIARDLGMQEATVKVHVRQIMRKLGAANRTEAALLAVQAETAALARQAARPGADYSPPETDAPDDDAPALPQPQAGPPARPAPGCM